MTPQLSYTTSEVSRISAVTLRQLQWWDEQSLVSPAIEGHCRVYRPRELFAVLLFRELLARGFSLGKVRSVWKQMQRQGFEMPDDSRRWMLTDGARVVFLADPDSVLAFLEQRRSPAFVLVPLLTLATRMTDQPAPTQLVKRGPSIARSPHPGGYSAGREAKRA